MTASPRVAECTHRRTLACPRCAGKSDRAEAKQSRGGSPALAPDGGRSGGERARPGDLLNAGDQNVPADSHRRSRPCGLPDGQRVRFTGFSEEARRQQCRNQLWRAVPSSALQTLLQIKPARSRRGASGNAQEYWASRPGSRPAARGLVMAPSGMTRYTSRRLKMEITGDGDDLELAVT